MAQWIGKGVLPHPKQKGKVIKYGDVLTDDVLKALGEKRVAQFKRLGKIGEVPMPTGPGAADEVIKLQAELAETKDSLRMSVDAHESLLNVHANLQDSHQNLFKEHAELTKEKANKKLIAENEELLKANDELQAQIAELTK